MYNVLFLHFISLRNKMKKQNQDNLYRTNGVFTVSVSEQKRSRGNYTGSNNIKGLPPLNSTCWLRAKLEL